MDYFNEVFLPNLTTATVTYKKWRQNFAKTEVPKWDAYLVKVKAHKKGEPRPVAPVFTSRFGKALVAAAEEHVSVIDLGAVWTPPDNPPPPPSSTYQNEEMIIRQSTETDFSTIGQYGVVELSSYLYSAVPVIKAAFPNCKVFFYKAASDCFDEGVGAQVPSLATRMQSRSGVTYNEILAHDAANPGDKWALTTNGSSPATPYFGFAGVYGGNIGKASFRQQWVTRVLEKFANEPLWDGVFVDNVTIQQPLGWPFELPNQTVWTTAMRDFCALAGPAVRGVGKKFSCNTNYFIAGDPSSDDGTGVVGWWNQIAQYVDVLFNEFPMQAPSDPGTLRLQGAGYPFSWDTWQSLVKVAQDLGSMGVLNINCHGSQGGVLNSRHVRYGRASAMLDWNGNGLCFSVDYFGSQPWSGPVALALGQPVGARTQSNGIHMRQFQLGWVAVNPTTTTRTATVGSTSRTIASGDAYLGPS